MLIVDDPCSPHGQRMQAALRADTSVTWLEPTLRLPDDLVDTSNDVVALPLRVRGGHLTDPFTRRLYAAIEMLMARGVSVFVALGPHQNPLAEAGIAVKGQGSGTRSASICCVLAAERLARSRHYSNLEQIDG